MPSGGGRGILVDALWRGFAADRRIRYAAALTSMAIRNVENSPYYKWGAGCDGWRLLEDPSLDVIQERMPGGTSEVPHLHERARQLFYVLEGSLEIATSSGTVAVPEGSAYEVSPGTRHVVRNPSAAHATFLVVSSPSSRGDRIDG